MTVFLQKVARTAPAAARAIPACESARRTDSLVDLVLEVVAQADWGRPDVDGRVGRKSTPRGEVLLATLTYCYALGFYSSTQIELAILRNPNNTELPDRVPLDRRSFAQFRRHNRDLLKACLTEVLGRMGKAEEAEQRIECAVESDFFDREE